MTDPARRWLLLVHQVPPTPAYLRAKVGRHLARLGAVAVKNSVYALPMTDDTREDFQWLAREVRSAGADATVFEAATVDGLTDADLIEKFRSALAPRWDELRSDAEPTRRSLARSKRGAQRPLAAEVAKLRRRADELHAIDFFAAPGGPEALARVAQCERLLRGDASASALPTVDVSTLKGRTWVTRRGVHVDRIATAWLVRRFVDPDARFLFVGRDVRELPADALRFDMDGGEFTHEGERCSFEVLTARVGLDDPALRAIGEIVHDLDLKDDRNARPETHGVGSIIAGICWSRPGDEARIELGVSLLDALYSHFQHTSEPRNGRRLA